MLPIIKLDDEQAHSNYTYNTRPMYYTVGGEPPGTWYGKGLKYAELKNGKEIRKADLGNIYNGYSISGYPLTNQAGSLTRTKAWELTFSVPKSLSVYWTYCDDKTRNKIQKSAFEAVKDALRYIEEKSAYSSEISQNGVQDKRRAKLIFGIFENSQNTYQQPDLHHHVLLINMCKRNGNANLIPVAISEIKTHRKAIEQVYYVSLSHRLNDVIKMPIYPRRNEFYLPEISPLLTDILSDDRRDGRLISRKSDIFHPWTKRSYKPHSKSEDNISRAQLFERCRYIEKQINKTRYEDLDRRYGSQPYSFDYRYNKYFKLQAIASIVRSEIDHISTEKTVFTEAEVLERCGYYAIERRSGIKELTECIRNEISSRCSLVDIVGQQPVYALRKLLIAEKEANSIIDNRPRTDRHVISEKIVSGISGRYPQLNDSQKNIIESIATENDSISLFRANSVNQRALIIRPIAEIYAESQYNVIGLALTASKAKSMEQKTGVPFYTINTFIENSEVLTTNPRKDKAQWKIPQKIWDEVNKNIPMREDITTSTVLNIGGNKTVLGSADKELNPKAYLSRTIFALGKTKIEQWKTAQERTMLHPLGPIGHPQAIIRIKGEQPTVIGKNTVVFVDQIERIDTRRQTAILQKAETIGLKMVLSGEEHYRHIQPKKAGSLVDLIEEKLHTHTLPTTEKNRSPETKKLLKDLEDENPRLAFEGLKAQGRFHESDSQESSVRSVIAQFEKRDAVADLGTVIIAPNRQLTRKINEAVQGVRMNWGKLGSANITLREGKAHEGDRVRFAVTSSLHDIKKGEVGVITKISGSNLTVRTEDGHDKRFSAREYDKLELGYAVSPQQAANTRISKALVVLGEKRANRENALRQMQNIKGEVHIYAVSKSREANHDSLMKQLGEAKGKRTTTDALNKRQARIEERNENIQEKWKMRNEARNERLRREAEQNQQRQTNRMKLL